MCVFVPPPISTEKMCRIHPTESKFNTREIVTTTSNYTTVWTVWKKSSMAFQGTDGFSVFDSEGRLAFRVDNYSRKSKCFAGELVLMDGAGRAVLTLRPQILSMYDQWNAFNFEDGSKARSRAQVFSMRRRSIIQNSDEAEVFLGSPTGKSSIIPDFRIHGCFRRRCCKIWGSEGEEVAQISRKKANGSVVLGNDVFSLVIQPGFDCRLIMAFVIVMDRICQKPFTPLMCS